MTALPFHFWICHWPYKNLSIRQSHYRANTVTVIVFILQTFSDERLKVTNEVLQGIKLLKLLGLEKHFENIIQIIRKKEMNVIKKSLLLLSFLGNIFIFIPQIKPCTYFTLCVHPQHFPGPILGVCGGGECKGCVRNPSKIIEVHMFLITTIMSSLQMTPITNTLKCKMTEKD